jgi:hypothetical protein
MTLGASLSAAAGWLAYLVATSLKLGAGKAVRFSMPWQERHTFFWASAWSAWQVGGATNAKIAINEVVKYFMKNTDCQIS